MIRNIEIICRPCHKCQVLEERIHTIIHYMELQKNIKIKYEFKLNKDIKQADKYGYNLSQLPILLINGNVAFVGHVKGENLVRMKLEEALRDF